jgi:hypothetical protein
VNVLALCPLVQRPLELRMMYFAYGSNMDWKQMRERCPSARFVCTALLPGHRLAFTRKSRDRGCGVADAVPEKLDSVWGVAYEIGELDFGNLDRSEGFVAGRNKKENAYTREERHVFAEGDQNKPLSAWVYFAEQQANPPPPSEEYRRLIVEGAKYWHLPSEYVARLEQIKT